MVGNKSRVVIINIALLVLLFVVFRKPFLRATMPVVDDVTLSEFVLINDSAFVKLTLTVRNKGLWNITLKHVQLSVFDDTLQILSYESDTLKTFRRNELKTEVLYCKIPFTEVLRKISQHEGEEKVTLQLKAVLVYSTILGESKSVVERDIPVNAPIPPRLFVRGISYIGNEDGIHNLVFDLTLKNDNPRTMDLSNVEYVLHSGDDIELHGTIEEISIAALDSTQIKVPAVMQVGSRFAIISRIILDKDVMPYSFVLHGTMESLTGVVEEDVPITVNTSGQMELYNEDRRDRPKITFRKNQR